MKTPSFTSTFSPELLAWVDKVARTSKQTRRAVLEDAVKKYRTTLESKSLEREFRKFANDPDIVEMAEWGMKEYSEMLCDVEIGS